MTATQYLSVCVDNQRINDLWFLVCWFVWSGNVPIPSPAMLDRNDSGQGQ
jgi:hypothetical protein